MNENTDLVRLPSEEKYYTDDPLKKPGRLRGISTFEIHTKAAQKIVLGYHLKDNRFTQNGSKGFMPAGLFKFASRITRLFQALVLDDPFAELYLAKVYRCLIQAKKSITAYLEQYQAKLTSVKGMTIEPYYSDHPKIFTLKSRNPYTGLAVQVICSYDALVRVIYAGQDRMIWDRAETNFILRKVREKIHFIFTTAFEWHYTAVTRYDVRHGTPIAKTAYQKMQVNLSSEIITGVFQAPLTPSRRYAEQMQNLTNHDES